VVRTKDELSLEMIHSIWFTNQNKRDTSVLIGQRSQSPEKQVRMTNSLKRISKQSFFTS